MENDFQGKSKTQLKKEAEELQKLGEALIKVPIHQLERMELPDALKAALIEAKSIKSNIAGRRQRQFIGTLMRNVDPEPVLHALQQADADVPIESEIEKKARVWLDSLLTGDTADIEAFISISPGLERQRLRQILRNIKKEKSTGKPSKSLTALKQLIMESMINN